MSKNGPVHSPSTSSFTSTSHNGFPQMPAGFLVLSLGLILPLFMGLFLPTPTQQPPDCCCLPHPAAKGSFLLLSPILFFHIWPLGSSDRLKSNEQGQKPKPVNFFSLTPNTELEEKPKNTPSSPSNPKKLARKAVLQEDQDCLNQVRRAGRQLI